MTSLAISRLSLSTYFWAAQPPPDDSGCDAEHLLGNPTSESATKALRAIASQPNHSTDPRLLRLAGVAMIHLGELDTAEKYLRSAGKLARKAVERAAIYSNLAIVSFRRARYLEAYQFAAVAMKTDPALVAAYLVAGGSIARVGNAKLLDLFITAFHEAFPTLADFPQVQDALRNDPELAEFWNAYSRCYPSEEQGLAAVADVSAPCSDDGLPTTRRERLPTSRY